MATQVSIYGKDSTLLSIRALVFSRVGIEVTCDLVCTDNWPEIRHATLAVLCSSLPFREQEQLAAKIKERWPDTAVLMIRPNASERSDPLSGIHICGSDPEQIVSSSLNLLRNSNIPA